MKTEKQILVLIGAPGSGKGTLSKLLSEYESYHHISTGDIFRKEAEENKEFAELLKSGQLIDDETVNAIVLAHIETIGADKVVLDGYPRTANQFDLFTKSFDVNVKYVLLQIPLDAIKRRIVNRVMSVSTGAIYHLLDNPPPEGEETYQREDDREELVSKRLKTFTDNVHSILASIARSKQTIEVINADQRIEDVYAELCSALNIKPILV